MQPDLHNDRNLEPPQLTVPSWDEWQAARDKTGELLASAFVRDGRYFTGDGKTLDYALIGETMAEAQESPTRIGMPYHPAVVKAWFDGALLPPSKIIQTTKKIAAKLMGEEWAEELEETYEAAGFDPLDAKRTFAKQMVEWLATLPSATDSSDPTRKFSYALLSPSSKKSISRPEFTHTLKTYHGIDDVTCNKLWDIYAELAAFDTWIKKQPTELSVTLNAYQSASELSLKATSRALAKLGVYSDANNAQQEKPIADPTIYSWISGKAAPDPYALRALDTIYSNEGQQVITPLVTIAQARRYHDAERLWRIAEREADVGMMLQALRTHMGLSLAGLAERISQHLQLEPPINPVTIYAWETNCSLPSAKTFGTRDPIDVYCELVMKAEQGLNPIIRENFGAFITPAREQILRQSLAHERQHVREIHYTGKRPARPQKKTPDVTPAVDLPILPVATTAKSLDEEKWQDAIHNHDFGGMLRMCREAQHLSYPAFAEELGKILHHPIAPRSIADWEKGMFPDVKAFQSTDPPTIYAEIMRLHGFSNTEALAKDLKDALLQSIAKRRLSTFGQTERGQIPGYHWLEYYRTKNPDALLPWTIPCDADQPLHAKCDAAWSAAIASQDFGTALKICRKALGCSSDDLAHALTQSLSLTRPMSATTVERWEMGRGIPGAELFVDRHPVIIYSSLMQHPCSPAQGWWTPQHERQLYELFTSKVESQVIDTGQTHRSNSKHTHWTSSRFTTPSPDTRTR
jgi:transcriptional regulator with XRE-family HTH domain